MPTALGIGAVIALVAATAFFVAAEFTYVTVKRGRLDDKARLGDERAEAALKVLKKVNFVLSGAQVGITLTSLILGFIAEPVLASAIHPVIETFGVSESTNEIISFIIAFLLSSVGLMVLGELVPKNIAIARPTRSALALARPTLLYTRATRPIVAFFDRTSNWVLRKVGIEPVEELHGAVSVDEFDVILESSAEQGKLTNQQADLLARALDFGQLTAASAMTPWNKVTKVAADTSISDFRALIVDSHSRFPVLDEDGHVTGVAHVKDLLHIESTPATSVAELARKTRPVPEQAALHVVLDHIRSEKTEMAIVVDEYGGPAGVVTLEDLVEELVGEIGDEFDEADDEPTIDQLTESEWLVPGSFRIDEIERDIGVPLPDDGSVETVAGVVMSRLQRLPEAGDTVSIGNVQLSVVEMDGWSVGSVRLTILVTDEDDT